MKEPQTIYVTEFKKPSQYIPDSSPDIPSGTNKRVWFDLTTHIKIQRRSLVQELFTIRSQ